MRILKKFFALFLIISFCPLQVAFAADDLEEAIVKNKDVFENNYQNITETAFRGLSPVERIFNKRESLVSNNVLYQQGYVFNSSVGANSSATGKFGSSYKLSIGEKLNVHASGESVDVITMTGNKLIEPSSRVEVDSNGFIYISGIGSVKAENRTLGEVESEVNSIAKNKYTNLRMQLSVASGTEFSVFVYGEVQRPGKVYVGNNSSILDALTAAGGVNKTGTLRNIKYNNSYVDLYKTLFLGSDNHILVKPNDVIFVDKIGEVVAIKNGVQVPGIYEIKSGETISNVIRYAGGILPTTEQTTITVVGFDDIQGQKTARNIQWSKHKTTKLSSGDSLEFKELYNGVENTVTLQGNIKHPQTVAYKKGMRLSDILKNENELLEETFITQAVIRRIDGKNNTIITIPVFLQDFFSGKTDPALQPRDVISIYRSTNSAFVDVYGCIDMPKHVPYIQNMTLKDVMADIQFVDSGDNSYKDDKTVFNSQEANSNEKFVSEKQPIRLSAEDVVAEITNKTGETRVFYLYDIMVNSDYIKEIHVLPEDKVFFRTLRDNETIKKVKISGFVKNPKVYSFIKGQRLTDVIEMAGGLSDDADLRGIVYNRFSLKNRQTEIAKESVSRDIQLLMGTLSSGYKQEASSRQQKIDTIDQLQKNESIYVDKYKGQIALSIKSNDLSQISEIDNILVQDGDDIYIPRMSNNVSVIGEVYNEQAFVYKKGARAKVYIKQVGGYTPNANKFRIYKVGANGKAKKISVFSKVDQGDVIVVPRKISGNDWLTPITQTLSSLCYIFIMAYGISKWK